MPIVCDKYVCGSGPVYAPFSSHPYLLPLACSKSCARCGHSFGVTRYRHHCRHCGESFCEEHSPFRHPIPKIGHLTPARVCHKCKVRGGEEPLRERR
jgi:hypothetical protein